MSIKGDIFKTIAAHLMAKLQFEDSSNIPSLRWVDKKHGQSPEIASFVPLPAVLFRFAETNWDNHFGNGQGGVSLIEFEIWFENYADSYEGSINQDKAIQYFEFNDAVFKALQGFNGSGFSSLHRVYDLDDDDHENVIITKLGFETRITDDTAMLGGNTSDAEYSPIPQFKNPTDRPSSEEILFDV